MVRDVEGRKPETLKESWRWIRGLLHDFVGTKKTINQYQRVIIKVESLLRQKSEEDALQMSS